MDILNEMKRTKDAIEVANIKLKKIRKASFLVNCIRILCTLGLIGLAITYHFIHVSYYMVIWCVLTVILIIISAIGIQCDVQRRKIYQKVDKLQLMQICIWAKSKEETANED